MRAVRKSDPVSFCNMGQGTLVSNFLTLSDLLPGSARGTRIQLAQDAAVHANEGFPINVLRM